MRYPTVMIMISLLVALSSAPAWAHPGFRPDEVPAGEQTEVELAIAHHCERPGGGISPTTVVAVQIPDAIAEVVPLDLNGWSVDGPSTSDSGSREFQWTAEQTTPDADPPVFRLRVVPDTQQTAITVEWKVFQGCEEGSHLWGGGSADEPPVRLTVTPGVYDAPDPSPSDATVDEPSPPITPDPDTPTAATTAPTTQAAEDDRGQSPASGTPWIPVATTAAVALTGLAIWVGRHRAARR